MTRTAMALPPAVLSKTSTNQVSQAVLLWEATVQYISNCSRKDGVVCSL